MPYEIAASHLQHEREVEAEHQRLVREARSAPATDSRVARVRTEAGLRLVALGLALGGDGARRRVTDAARSTRALAIQAGAIRSR